MLRVSKALDPHACLHRLSVHLHGQGAVAADVSSMGRSCGQETQWRVQGNREWS
jgi:hypothetical protein